LTFARKRARFVVLVVVPRTLSTPALTFPAIAEVVPISRASFVLSQKKLLLFCERRPPAPAKKIEPVVSVLNIGAKVLKVCWPVHVFVPESDTPPEEPPVIHAPPVVVAKQVAIIPPENVVVPEPVTARLVVEIFVVVAFVVDAFVATIFVAVALVATRFVAVALVNVPAVDVRRPRPVMF